MTGIARHIQRRRRTALRHARLDAKRCRVCTVRIFNECPSVLPDGS